jgi:hypothetical protein
VFNKEKKREGMLFLVESWCQSVLLRTCKHGSRVGALKGELRNLSKELGEQIDFA